MSNLPPDPRRWKDEHEQTNVAERAAGETLRSWPPPEALGPVALARIAARIRATRPRTWHRFILVTAALLLGVATAASAARLHILPAWITSAKPKSMTGVPHESPKVWPAHKGRSVATGDVPAPAEVAPAVELPSALANPPAVESRPSAESAGSDLAVPMTVPGAHRPAPRPPAPASSGGPVERKPPAAALPPEPASRTLPPARPSLPGAGRGEPAGAERQPALVWAEYPPAAATLPEAPSPEPTKAVPSEAKRGSGAAQHLSEALRALRVEHDAKTTLALLDRHAAELTRNALGHEALILRVEALLALGREGAALRLLDGAALTDVAAAHSLLVTRGRLRAAANRCADGVGDFDLVLAESRKPERQALFGRAVCRKLLGDGAGARADLERYRREFPNDPRLGELERRLAVLP